MAQVSLLGEDSYEASHGHLRMWHTSCRMVCLIHFLVHGPSSAHACLVVVARGPYWVEGENLRWNDLNASQGVQGPPSFLSTCFWKEDDFLRKFLGLPFPPAAWKRIFSRDVPESCLCRAETSVFPVLQLGGRNGQPRLWWSRNGTVTPDRQSCVVQKPDPMRSFSTLHHQHHTDYV